LPDAPATFQSRWCPRWCAALFLPAWAVASWALALPHLSPLDPRCLVALGPLIAVTGYAVCLFSSNATRAQVSPEGVRLSHGPLPGGPPPLALFASEIRRVYFRHARFPTIAGAIRFHAAGVETTVGEMHDLVSGFPSEHDARAAAERIAHALGLPRTQVEEVPRSPRASFRPIALWSAAILVSFAWVFLVDAFT
jgi:hypothetical protein